jgi:hypothetical protein
MATKIAEEIATALEVEGSQGLIVRKFQKMSGKERWDLLEKCPVQPFTSRQVVSIFEEPVSQNDLFPGKPGIVSTKGNYAICYNTIQNQMKNGNRPYAIYTDLLDFHKLDVSGPVHLRELARRIPEIKWMLRNTNFNFGLFALAKMHPGSQFNFTVNWVEYSEMISAKAKAQGIDLDNKPLVSYKCNYEDFENKFYKAELAPKHNKEYYKKELKEAEEEAKNERE